MLDLTLLFLCLVLASSGLPVGEKQRVHIKGSLLCFGESAEIGYMLLYDVNAVLDELMDTDNPNVQGGFELNGTANERRSSDVRPVIVVYHYCYPNGVARNNAQLVTKVPIPQMYVGGGTQQIVIELERYRCKTFTLFEDGSRIAGVVLRKLARPIISLFSKILSVT